MQNTTTPMSERIEFFKAEFVEFSNLDEDHIHTLISIYDQNCKAKYCSSEPQISLIGGLLLWVGWIFFNSASGYEIVMLSYDSIPTNIAINTFSAAAVSGLSFACFEVISFSNAHRMKIHSGGQIMNAILSGLVGITASCNNVSVSSAATIGLVSAIVYKTSTKLLHRWQIDDPVEASQIHGFCGLWGLIAVGIFDIDKGLIYSGSFEQMRVQLVGALALSIWTIGFCYIFFRILMKIGRFRVSHFYEVIGIDLLMHSSLNNLDVNAFIDGKNQSQTEKQDFIDKNQ